MSHIPVNHPLRPLYRVLAALVGSYVLVFGIVGLTQTKGISLFAQTDLPWVLGLRTNRAFALLSLAAGAVLLVGALLGRNIDRFVNIVGGVLFMVAGMGMLALMDTNANFLGFSMVNCVVSLVIGTLLLAAGLYGKTDTRAKAGKRIKAGIQEG